MCFPLVWTFISHRHDSLYNTCPLNLFTSTFDHLHILHFLVFKSIFNSKVYSMTKDSSSSPGQVHLDHGSEGNYGLNSRKGQRESGPQSVQL